jgi:hypothetical protein
MQQVGAVLLEGKCSETQALSRWLVCKDAFEESPCAASALYVVISKAKAALQEGFGEPQEVSLTEVTFRTMS